MQRGTWFVLLVAASCGPGQVNHTPGEASRSRSIVDDNGISLNGLMTNGLMTNGLTVNGVQMNGVQMNGVQMNGFSINGLSLDESLNVMKYLVKCALADWQTMTINVDGIDYSWPGRLGLAQEWADGPLTDQASQAWVSSCLMALANADGRSQSVSLRADPVPYDSDEAARYSVAEGVFVGNFFSDRPGAYACPLYAASNQDYLNGIGRRCSMPGSATPLLTECKFGSWQNCQPFCEYVDAINIGAGGYFRCSNASITVYDQNP